MRILGFDSLPSTNTYAKEHIKNLLHNDIITADTQSDGRGRMRRLWLSPKGGLYFSVVLKPQGLAPRAFCSFTLAMALAVCKTLKNNGVEAYIKWPNDVLCGGKKLCGILSEGVFDESGAFLGLVIGAGLNVSQENLVCDKPAVTLKALGFNFERALLLKEICTLFEGYCNDIYASGFKALQEEFKRHIPALGQVVSLRTAKGFFTGTARDISAEGFLLLQTQEGAVEEFSVGDMDF